jgi:hypothetical protein
MNNFAYSHAVSATVSATVSVIVPATALAASSTIVNLSLDLFAMDLPPGLPVRIPPATRATPTKVFCFCYLQPYNGGRHSIGRTTRHEHFQKCRQRGIPFNEQEAEIYRQYPEFQHVANQDNGFPFINDLFVEEQDWNDSIMDSVEYRDNNIPYGTCINSIATKAFNRVTSPRD